MLRRSPGRLEVDAMGRAWVLLLALPVILVPFGASTGARSGGPPPSKQHPSVCIYGQGDTVLHDSHTGESWLLVRGDEPRWVRIAGGPNTGTAKNLRELLGAREEARTEIRSI